MVYLLSIITEHKLLKLDRNFIYSSNFFVSVGSRVKINFNGQKLIGFVLKVEEVDNIRIKEKELSFKIKEIDEIIDESPIINNNLLSLAYKLKERYLYPLIGVLNTMLPPSLKSESSFLNKPKIKYLNYYLLNNKNYQAKNKVEQRILDHFRNNSLVLSSTINKSATLDNLINKSVISLVKKEKYRYQAKEVFHYDEGKELNKEQKQVLDEILFSRENKFLIKGVTGSGKTLIYIKLIEDALKEDKASLLLVPEVALTTLMISRILSYFDMEIAVLHSSLTNANRYDEYRKISQGKVKVVIGTRSAIFAPLMNLKYIIIDEEHDESYKQDINLTYNAKDVAFIRAKIENCKVILGSATPSIETMARAKNNDIKLLSINKKYFDSKENTISLVDAKDETLFKKSPIFSDLLIDKINERLLKNEQVILLINRRGYSSSLICNDCGYVFKCPNCNLALTYHKENNSLICHHCDFNIKYHHKCPICASENIKLNGYGIEKVEEEFKRTFKNIPYLILNSDLTPTLNQIEEVLRKFNNKEANILIGTQIVSKGHDFKDVSLVGILNADSFLTLPTYKTSENAFSLLVQTIGRSGRFIDGEAVIQLKEIKNKIVEYSIKNDYDSFYNYEIEQRKKYHYPPFVNLFSLRICSKDLNLLKKECNKILLSLKKLLVNCEINLSLFQEMYRSYYSYQIFIKCKNYSLIREAIAALLYNYSSNNQFRLYFLILN